MSAKSSANIAVVFSIGPAFQWFLSSLRIAVVILLGTWNQAALWTALTPSLVGGL
jgi:hypothetical protein